MCVWGVECKCVSVYVCVLFQTIPLIIPILFCLQECAQLCAGLQSNGALTWENCTQVASQGLLHLLFCSCSRSCSHPCEVNVEASLESSLHGGIDRGCKDCSTLTSLLPLPH